MGMLHVRLLVLIVLGTISRCQDIAEYLTDVVTVVNSGQAFPSSCASKASAIVRFNEIKLPGPDSDVVYQRQVVSRAHLEFAATAIANFNADSFLQCAKAAASEGLDAFTSDGSCTGYRLEKQFMCQAGDLVLYVRKGSIDNFPVVMSFEEASYEIIDNADEPYRQYMFAASMDISEINNLFFKEEFEANLLTRGHNFVFLENQETYRVYFSGIDLNVCMTDGSYGLPMAFASPTFQNQEQFPRIYFFHECGNTVKVVEGPLRYWVLIVHSHPGYGCKYYPSELLPDECTVTFEIVDSTDKQVSFGFYFPESGSEYGAFSMTLTGEKNQDGTTTTKHLNHTNSVAWFEEYDKIIASLTEQPTKQAVGFYLFFQFE